jgi:ESS family glutamate:Na+ symporter
MCFNWICQFEAYRYTTIATATLCYYMQPVFYILAGAAVLKERLSPKKLACVAAAFGGMVLVSGVLQTGFHVSEMKGAIFGAAGGFFYAMVVMLIVWRLIVVLKWDHLFDEKVRDKISGTLTDFIVVAAISSLNLSVLSTYWVTLAITCVLGLIVTPTLIMLVCKKFMRSNWFEKSLGLIGANTGVFVTGILLIKMADPDLKTDALLDYSIGGTLCNLFAMPLISFILGIMANAGVMSAFLFAAGTSIACFIPILISWFAIGRKAA